LNDSSALWPLYDMTKCHVVSACFHHVSDEGVTEAVAGGEAVGSAVVEICQLRGVTALLRIVFSWLVCSTLIAKTNRLRNKRKPFDLQSDKRSLVRYRRSDNRQHTHRQDFADTNVWNAQGGVFR
jgi:hypothetical protein